MGLDGMHCSCKTGRVLILVRQAAGLNQVDYLVKWIKNNFEGMRVFHC